jgi:hypothetical protein
MTTEKNTEIINKQIYNHLNEYYYFDSYVLCRSRKLDIDQYTRTTDKHKQLWKLTSLIDNAQDECLFSSSLPYVFLS